MQRHWQAVTAPLRQEFDDLLDRGRLRALHRTSGALHALVALRQLLLATASSAGIVRFSQLWYVWLPCAILLGFVVFSFTVLLHEVVHHTVFRRRHIRANRLLAWLYAIPAGLSPSQFTRWHLDHHAELGTRDRDPKRHHLTPKRVNRRTKLLYMTPWLFPIYFAAAGREATAYEPEFRLRLGRERALVMLAHLLAIGAITWAWGAPMLFKLYLVPVFFVFPVAFTINRLGQHYDIEPSDPAAWGTIIRTNPVWDFLFLWSSYHMEHHYFPSVPFYNLAALHRELKPVLQRHPMRVRTYGGLLYDWFVRNARPHQNWR